MQTQAPVLDLPEQAVMGCLARWYNTSRAARHRNKGGGRQLAAAIGDDNERMSVASETEEESGKQSACQPTRGTRHVELTFALPLTA